ncbi:unnamed protein product [marine sediment metagenome]|uniref:Uncharacterized protein n=1 Tax=marine sediment metagenome TaxID=412755 RepID=X0VN35_9ZZZZ
MPVCSFHIKQLDREDASGLCPRLPPQTVVYRRNTTWREKRPRLLPSLAQRVIQIIVQPHIVTRDLYLILQFGPETAALAVNSQLNVSVSAPQVVERHTVLGKIYSALQMLNKIWKFAIANRDILAVNLPRQLALT